MRQRMESWRVCVWSCQHVQAERGKAVFGLDIGKQESHLWVLWSHEKEWNLEFYQRNMGRWLFAVSHFPEHTKGGGHFSTIAKFWEHRAQADFIMVHGNLIRIGGIRQDRCDTTQGESIQMGWKATSYPGREKAFHKEYSGKNDWFKDNVEGGGGGLVLGCCRNITFKSKLKVCRWSLRPSLKAKVKCAPKSTSGGIKC